MEMGMGRMVLAVMLTTGVATGAAAAGSGQDGWEYAPAPGSSNRPGIAYRIPFQNDPPYERGEIPDYVDRPLDPYVRLYGHARPTDPTTPPLAGAETFALGSPFPDISRFRAPDLGTLTLPEVADMGED